MSGWEELKISDVGEVITGKTPPTANKDNFGGTIPFITPSDMNGEKYLERTSRHITEKGLQTVKNSYIPAGSIIVSCIGSDMGKVSINREAGVTNQQINSIVVNDRVVSEYVYYVLRPRKNELLALATSGSAQPILNKGHFSALTINIPPRDVQKKIADILGSLDQKIELNQRMNETLEGMARAIFKSWFVDFDPVHSKAEGREPEGMDSQTAALFPSAFTPDGLPEGWTQGTLGRIAESAGVTVQPSQTSPDTPYIGLEHMPRRCITLSEWEGAGKVTSNKFAFVRGDFLFGKLRPYFHKVGIAAIDGISSTDILIVRSKSEEFYAFVLSVISSDEFVGYTDQASRGTKMPRTNWKDMAAYEIVLPDRQVALAYNAVVKPMLEKIIANAHENQTLAALRDTLLPKLISGELRVGDADTLIKEAV